MKTNKKTDYSLLFKSEEVIDNEQMGTLKGGQAPAQSVCKNCDIGVPDMDGSGLEICTILYIGWG